MAEPIRIRAKVTGGVTEVHVLMPHPMETGLRANETGHSIAAHYITDVHISAAGRPVLAARMGVAVSRDPLLVFRFKGASAGDGIAVAWADNRGERRTDATIVS